MSACVLHDTDVRAHTETDPPCDFTSQTEGPGLTSSTQEAYGHSVDCMSQTPLPTRDVYCMTQTASSDVIDHLANQMATCVPTLGQGDSERRGEGVTLQGRCFSDVTCQVGGATASVSSQCDLHAAGRTDLDKRSSASQCDLPQTAAMMSCHSQTTPTAVTSSHVMCQTPPTEGVEREGLSVWAGTDSTSQTETARCDVTVQLDSC